VVEAAELVEAADPSSRDHDTSGRARR